MVDQTEIIHRHSTAVHLSTEQQQIPAHCFYVCLLEYLKTRTIKLHEIFCACYLQYNLQCLALPSDAYDITAG